MYRYITAFALLFAFTSSYGQDVYRVKTVAGDSAGYRNGPDSVALFNSPTGICSDTTGNLFITDTYNNVIRKISLTDSVTTFAGKDSAGYRDGVDSNAEFDSPEGICIDKNGNLYIADTYNNVIRKVSGGMVSTLAGDGHIGFRDGQADSAEFYLPTSVAVDTNGNVYVADNGNFSVREISNTGSVSTIAGTGYAGFKNGNIDTAEFDGLSGITVSPSGTDIYVTEYINNDVRLIQGGFVTVFAGTDSSLTNIGYVNGNSVNQALFHDPIGITLDKAGNVFVTDEYNNVIRQITNSFVTTLAGNDTAGYRDTLDYESEFNQPYGITKNKGVLYVTDNANNRIRKIAPININGGFAALSSNKIALSVYPNPCSDKLIVATAPTGNAQIVDVTGRQVWNKEHLKAPYIISTENLAPGLYFLQVSNIDGVATSKIMIER